MRTVRREGARARVTLEQVMRALGDPVRLSVVRQLLKCAGEEKACGTFDYAISKATFSHHLKILREAGIIQTRQDGTRKMTSLCSETLERRFPGLIGLISRGM
jgi:DNA-binding transcriptional ArsR family regulator